MTQFAINMLLGSVHLHLESSIILLGVGLPFEIGGLLPRVPSPVRLEDTTQVHP